MWGSRKPNTQFGSAGISWDQGGKSVSLSEEEKSSWEWKGNIREPIRLSGNVRKELFFLYAGTSCLYHTEQCITFSNWASVSLSQTIKVRWEVYTRSSIHFQVSWWVGWDHHDCYLCSLNVWYNYTSPGSNSFSSCVWWGLITFRVGTYMTLLC